MEDGASTVFGCPGPTVAPVWTALAFVPGAMTLSMDLEHADRRRHGSGRSGGRDAANLDVVRRLGATALVDADEVQTQFAGDLPGGQRLAGAGRPGEQGAEDRQGACWPKPLRAAPVPVTSRC